VLIRRIARPMLATMFIAGGIDSLRNPAGKAQAAAPLLNKGAEALPDQLTDNVPTDPDTLVKVNGAVQVGGGLLLASGKMPRLASLALAGSLVPTTFAGHPFWEESDPDAKAAQKIHFLKNVSLLGGLLIAAVDTEGKPSVGWRSRRAAKRASQAVSVALPFAASGASNTSDTLGHAAGKAADRGQDLAQRIAASDTTKRLSASGADWAHTARVRAAELASVAAERGNELAQVAAERGSTLAQAAADRGPGLAAQARERGSDFAALASDRGAVLAEQARARGAELAKENAKKSRKAARRWNC